MITFSKMSIRTTSESTAIHSETVNIQLRDRHTGKQACFLFISYRMYGEDRKYSSERPHYYDS